MNFSLFKHEENWKNLQIKREIEDRFYRDLEFGTGGLRGIMGAGTNRMNKYTVGWNDHTGLTKVVFRNGLYKIYGRLGSPSHISM